MTTAVTFTGCLRVFPLLFAAVIMLSFCQPNLAQSTEDSAISSLVSGLFVNEDIVKRLLPQSLQLQGSLTRKQREVKMKQFYELLHSLTLLSEREKQLSTMLTLPDHQGKPELMAIQVVLQKLIDNACELLKFKVGDQTECTYADLMVLKTKVEALQTVDDKVIPTLQKYRNGVIQGIYKTSWLTENVVCNLSSDSLSVLNSFRLYGRTYSQDNC